MESYYSLQINIPDEKIEIVDKLLGVKSSDISLWELRIVQKKEDEYIPYIDYFLSILEGKYEKLEEIGIKRDNISIWMVYYYDSQCNMEFSPKEMYNLGKEGIKFCISCYDIHDYEEDYYGNK